MSFEATVKQSNLDGAFTSSEGLNEDLRVDDRGRGLFDGYEAYRTPKDDDYRKVLTDGLVIVDTNVLLNLYRYSAQARKDFLEVLRALRDNLWVPERVVHEFWTNRESVLRDPRGTAETLKQLDELSGKARTQITKWAKLASLSTDSTGAMIRAAQESIEFIRKTIEEHEEEQYAAFARNTNIDPVLTELEDILNGKVGAAFSVDEFDDLVKQGNERVAAEIPPGFSDVKRKGEEGAYGDYLVWEQLLREASVNKRDVLFVTADSKPDWWRMTSRGELRGPHRDLVKELHERAGARLFMLQPDQLLKYAKSTLQVSVDEGSAAFVAQVGNSLADDEDLPTGGWSAEALKDLLVRLDYEAPVQAKAIRVAATKNGYISRNEVYALGDYDPSRQLKGFTRPVKRIVQEFRDKGVVPEEAVDVLATEYDHTNFGWASGFTLSEQLIPLLVP